MRTGEGAAAHADALGRRRGDELRRDPGAYRALLEAAGFRVEDERDWTDFVLEARARSMRARLAAEGIAGPRPAPAHGPDGIERLRRVGECVASGLLAPSRSRGHAPP